MRLQYTERFRQAYKALPDKEARAVQKALRLLAAGPHYPSLRVRKIQSTDGILEARAIRPRRLTFEAQGDLLVLRNAGPHDEVLGNP